MSTSKPAESIFHAALQLDEPLGRAAYLDDVCRGDQRLRQRVEALLAADLAGGFLEPPVAGLAATAILPEIREKPGATIGPYKLLEQIGEGGMGLVFMAEQSQPLRRRVALKIIKPGLDTQAVIARFEAERQALALMDHPNIARVFDAGATDTGRPYFVMELVRGAPITDYCRDGELSLHERLELFIEVCQAVQHAHQKGVIHRDLKPTNILVAQSDTKPVPKVIDFGVAKATAQPLTDRTLFTHFSQIIGTPLYMSPEQADVGNQDVDTRSDVYSLGVVLYELLTGTTPFDAERLRNVGPDEMRRIIREEEPPKPSTRATTVAAATTAEAPNKGGRQRMAELALKGDLDWIVMKALDKDRRRRYESASALATDLQRYLDDEPVEACPPSGRYRLAKYLRRNRVALLTTATMVAMVLIGSGVSIWQAVRATNAEQAKDVALKQARLAVDEMYTGVAEKWLNDQGSLTTVQRELLEKALAFYDTFSAAMGDEPEVQYEALRSLWRVGSIRRRLGSNAAAERAFLQAVERSTKCAQDFPGNPEFRIELIAALTSLASIHRNIDQADEGKDQLDRAYHEFGKLPAEAIQERAHRQRLASTLGTLANELTAAGRLKDTETAIQTALQTWQSLIEDDPADFEYRYGFARAYCQLGTRQMWFGSTDGKAEVSLRKADELITKLVEERRGDVGSRKLLHVALTNLGIVIKRQRRHAEAVELDRRSLSISEELIDAAPDDSDVQISYAITLRNLASALSESKLGEAGEADRLRLKGHTVLEKLVQAHPDEIEYVTIYLNSLMGISRTYNSQGDRETSRRFHESAAQNLAAIAAAHGNNVFILNRVCICLTEQAALYVDLGDHVRAGEIIAKFHPGMCAFHPRLVLPHHLEPDEFAEEQQRYYEAQVNSLTTPVALLEECILLAEQDETLSHAVRIEAITSYTAQAKPLRAEADIAVDAWVRDILTPRKDAGFRVAFHGDEQLKELFGYQSETGISPPLRRAYMQGDSLLFSTLVHTSAHVLSDNPELCYVAALLATAPPELQDPDFALQLARRGVDVAPEFNHAHHFLAWALFRVGQWEACVDAFSKLEDSKKGGSRYVLTMALWKLGRRKEARDLFDGAQQRLQDYEKKCQENAAKGLGTLPSLATVTRLHNEAAQMLSEPDDD